MDFATIFRLEENLNLDKKTLVFLRWIAIFGQLFSVNLVYFFLDLNFPVLLCHVVIFIGLFTNIYLQFGLKATLLKDLYSTIFLMYDIIQLSVLLFLTGGIFNPFAILLIVPTIVSSTFLSMGSTIILGTLTIFLLFYSDIFQFAITWNGRIRSIVSKLLCNRNINFFNNWPYFFELFWYKICWRNKKKVGCFK